VEDAGVAPARIHAHARGQQYAAAKLARTLGGNAGRHCADARPGLSPPLSVSVRTGPDFRRLALVVPDHVDDPPAMLGMVEQLDRIDPAPLGIVLVWRAPRSL